MTIYRHIIQKYGLKRLYPLLKVIVLVFITQSDRTSLKANRSILKLYIENNDHLPSYNSKIRLKTPVPTLKGDRPCLYYTIRSDFLKSKQVNSQIVHRK